MDNGVAVVVVVVVAMLGAGGAILLRGRLSAGVRFPWGGGVDVAASRDPAPSANPVASVRDAESTDGAITARSRGRATVDRARAKGDITAIGGEAGPKD